MGVIMRNLKRLAYSILALCTAGAASAQAEETQRYDKKIEKAAAERVASKMGELRGTIQPDAEDFLYDENDRPFPILGFPIIKEQIKGSGLPPIVSVEEPNIDRIMTGSVSKQ